MRPFAATLLSVILLTFATSSVDAKTCIQPWAEVGKYLIEGDFRGRVERATAHLTPACRVTINLPGVFTGGPVKAKDGCLQFSFKVQKQPETFTALWCGGYAIVPWKGRDMRATVFRVREREPQTW